MSALSGIFGWFENKWIRQPLILGPSEALQGQVVELDATAGTNVIYGDTVPSDEIWVLLSATHINYNTANSSVLMGIALSGVGYPFNTTHTAIVARWYSYGVYQVLLPGYQPYAAFYNCSVGDDIQFLYAGFKLFTGET